MLLEKKEVLSVPAGKSYPCIEANSIHACPDTTAYSYKPAQYITFRKPGGIMERLYEIKHIIVFNPYDVTEVAQLAEKYKTRVQNYINDRMREWPFDDRNPRRFYLLSKGSSEGTIELPHKPQMPKNSSGHCYYTIAELTSGKKIVEIASRQTTDLTSM